MACPGGQVVCSFTGTWAAGEAPDVLTNGQQGGAPLVLFDAAVANALVISPYSNFMAGSQEISSGQDGALQVSGDAPCHEARFQPLAVWCDGDCNVDPRGL